VTQDVSLNAVCDGVFEVRLNRPERMNALGVATCAALERAVSEAAQKRERAALPDILGSPDYAEGLAAFAERRSPRFTEVVQ
jgi:enoyl-CoA hydratase/carnithine racemase